MAKKGGPEQTAHSVVFLVDAWSIAEHDGGAGAAIARAQTAPAAEAAAKAALAQAEPEFKSAEKVCAGHNTSRV